VSHAMKRTARHLFRVFPASLLLLFANIAYSQNTISTVAGGPPPNNVSPTGAGIEGPYGIVRDTAGNLFVITDSGVIYKVIPNLTAPSSMAIYAGNNIVAYSGDGGASTSALTNQPFGGAVDASGDLYFSDSGNCVVREIVASTGIINTVAGNGACNYTGDGGLATSATLAFPNGVTLDGPGNLFIADGNNVIRRVDATTKIITTYAGTGAVGYTGDTGQATLATFNFPLGIAADTSGNLFIADQGNNVIRRVDGATKVITTVVGFSPGNPGFSGDGGPATSATLNQPGGVAVDGSDNLYIADTDNAAVRKVVASTNQITTIVGHQGYGFGGDNGPGASATLTNPFGLAVDSAGDVWIADYWNNRIRLYSGSNLTIATVVGNGTVGDGGPATSASLHFPRSPALDSQGDLFITDAQNNRIREVNATTQVISTVVGNGIPCPQPTQTCGDGGPATSASIYVPRTVTIEPSGNLLVADANDNRIREVVAGTITTIAGTGAACVTWPCGDGGPAINALLNNPRSPVLDSVGNIYFVDAVDNRVRKIDTNGIITTVAGNGPNGDAPVGYGAGSYTGDGMAAVSSTLSVPLGVDIDSSGNLYIADTLNNAIRRIDAVSQIITTVAGNGTAAFSGDGGPATSASLNAPDRVSLNAAGNFFISDTNNNRIRRVDGTTQIITTFAGNGILGFGGDGGPALSASFANPTGVIVTNQGNMYVGDLFNNRIRLVLLNPNVSLSSSTVPFVNQPIDMSAMMPVTVTNSGDAPLTISSIAISSGAFSPSTSATPCPVATATLAVGASCVIEIAFMPTQFTPPYTGTITITDNGPTPGSVQTIDLTGTGGASLTVAVTGSGTVSSSPTGINCGASGPNCTATFTGNSTVILSEATAGPGAVFTGWGGACASSETTPSCSVMMTQNQNVAAAFTSTPVLTSVNPATGQQGAQNLSIVITGSSTHFVQGTTVLSFSGTGITVPSLIVSSATTATAVLNISASASTGARDLIMTTGAEVATLSEGFLVTAASAPFVVTLAPGTPSTPNVPPGGSLAVGLILTGGPTFSGTVTLTCASPDTSITCTIQPGSITLTGNGTTQVAIVVNTYCTANLPPLGPNPGAIGGGLGLMMLALMLGGVWTDRRRPRWAISFAMLMLVVFAGAACNSLPKSPSGAATQPGLKNIVVTAQAGGNSQNVSIQFNVE
jgi:trimeric autotransporter adhesin